MSKLLYANFVRLKHDTCFWVILLGMAAIGVILPVSTFKDMQRFPDYVVPLENSFTSYIPLIVIFAAAFCSLFIGTEYSDGTIRNKVIIGHRRADIYLSNLIVCYAAECIMCFAFIAANLCVGIPLLGFFQCGLSIILGYTGCALVLCAAVTALYTLIAMLSQNKAVAAVICTLGIVFMIFGGAYLNAMITAPEVYEAYTYIDSDGNIEESGAIPNPHYISGNKRVVYEFLNEFLPGNQTVLLWEGTAVHLWQMSLYSGIIAVAVTGFGIFVFCEEDIK
ncbi:MAG: ABC transporter permease [Lachnospiraceae bacterium]|nr:ABC transporter permease [Lachnospiraceae bacterium]